jgi:hypothetical protein
MFDADGSTGGSLRFLFMLLKAPGIAQVPSQRFAATG